MQERELHEWRTAAPGREELFQRMMSREYMEKRISRFVKTEGRRKEMAGTPVEEIIRPFGAEDKMAFICGSDSLVLERGQYFLFFRARETAGGAIDGGTRYTGSRLSGGISPA